MKEFMSAPVRQKPYQALGDLELDFPGVSPAEATNYRRDLDLDTGITTVQYTFAGKTYRREVFANYPSNVIVIRLTGGDYKASIKSAHDGTTTPEYIEGAIPGGAIRYAARYVTVREKDG